MKETWKVIPNYPDYDVSDLGQVRSRKRAIPYLLKPYKHKQGYLCVSLHQDNKRTTCLIHQLVLLAFVGPNADNLSVCHRDGSVDNNQLSNLYYGSHQENMIDKCLHGKAAKKLTQRKVRIIRGLRKCGFTVKRLAEIFSVSSPSICRVCRKQAWNNVE